MKVTFDLSVLGPAAKYKSVRAGVYRMVKNVATGLAESTDLDVRWSAFSARETCGWVKEYVRNDKILSGRQFVNNSTLTPNGSLLTRVRGLRPANKIIMEKLNRWRMNDVDIFHSPMHALPGSIPSTKKLKRFLTINDIIALKFPEYSMQEHVDMVALAVNSLRDDDCVCCISEATRNDLLNYRPDLSHERVFVTPLAASSHFTACTDTDAISRVKVACGIPTGAPYLLSLCTLEPRKNLAHVVRCFTHVLNQPGLADSYLVLVGPKGWKCEQLFSTLKALNKVRDRIIVTGFLDDDDLPAIYSGASAFVYMSLYEGFGLPPLEAMSCGTPVIVSNTSSLPEVVGDAGIQLDPRDEDGLCQAMIDVCTSTELQRELSQRSLLRAKCFSWKRCIEETKSAYRAASSM